MDEVFKYLGNGKIVIYVSLACIAITAVISIISRNLRFIKYIPGLLFVIVGIFNLFLAVNSFTESASLNYFSLSVVLLVGGLVGILSALIVGVYNKPIRLRRKRRRL